MSKVTKLKPSKPKIESDIQMFFHCNKCLKEASIPQYIEVGFTEVGIQVWCRRHNLNIIHINFEGHLHPMK